MLHIIDDEEVIRDSLEWLAKSREIKSKSYSNANALLAWIDHEMEFDPDGDCILLDVRMPDFNGVALFDVMASRHLTQRLPVIFLTGHGDVPMAVDMLKKGAFDFFEKPFNDNKLMDRIIDALAASRIAGVASLTQEKRDSLTEREKEVLKLILEGKLNKIIADELGISIRTVEAHRARIFEKMNVRKAVELSQLFK
ncbi:MAG: response regulator transcription factor [Burkholderiaceae bacterium]